MGAQKSSFFSLNALIFPKCVIFSPQICIFKNEFSDGKEIFWLSKIYEVWCCCLFTVFFHFAYSFVRWLTCLLLLESMLVSNAQFIVDLTEQGGIVGAGEYSSHGFVSTEADQTFLSGLIRLLSALKLQWTSSLHQQSDLTLSHYNFLNFCRKIIFALIWVFIKFCCINCCCSSSSSSSICCSNCSSCSCCMQLMHGMLTSVRSNAKSVIEDIQLRFQRLHSVLQARYVERWHF